MLVNLATNHSKLLFENNSLKLIVIFPPSLGKWGKKFAIRFF